MSTIVIPTPLDVQNDQIERGLRAIKKPEIVVSILGGLALLRVLTTQAPLSDSCSGDGCDECCVVLGFE